MVVAVCEDHVSHSAIELLGGGECSFGATRRVHDVRGGPNTPSDPSTQHANDVDLVWTLVEDHTPTELGGELLWRSGPIHEVAIVPAVDHVQRTELAAGDDLAHLQ